MKRYYITRTELFTKQKDYYKLPTKVSQQILMQVDKEFKSFFALIKKKLKPNIPKYKDKVKGRNILIYTIYSYLCYRLGHWLFFY